MTEAWCARSFTASSLVPGPHGAPTGFFLQGFRTLEDIRSKASLTTQQAIGLKHYDDFLERIPREEATEIEQTVSRCLRAGGEPGPAMRFGPGPEPRAPALSWGAEQAEAAMGHQRLGPGSKEQVEPSYEPRGGVGGCGRGGLQDQLLGLGLSVVRQSKRQLIC